MANTLNPNKEKIIFAEWSDKRDELLFEAQELSKKEGRDISEAELLRRITAEYINKRRKARGQKPLDLDSSSSPGGHPLSHVRGVKRRHEDAARRLSKHKVGASKAA